MGFGLYYIENNKIIQHRVDIVSHELKADGFSVVRALRFLRNQEFFKKFEKKNYIFWSDAGLFDLLFFYFKNSV